MKEYTTSITNSQSARVVIEHVVIWPANDECRMHDDQATAGHWNTHNTNTPGTNHSICTRILLFRKTIYAIKIICTWTDQNAIFLQKYRLQCMRTPASQCTINYNIIIDDVQLKTSAWQLWMCKSWNRLDNHLTSPQ